MTAKLIRKKFLEFFKKQAHVIVPSSSLIPDNDPSVLLTTAGMQQFKPYFLGERDPDEVFKSRRLASVQRCFRTSDIEQIGDSSHLTFFEMLGNFSLGDYSKAGAISLAWECLIKIFKIQKDRLWVTIFSGDERSVKDFEAFKLWGQYLPKERICEFGRSDNWWGPPGSSGPCGPSSEIHFDLTHTACGRGKNCLPNCACERFIEIWNLVFMEFFQNEQAELTSLPTKNVDTGMGLERLALILQNKPTIFETDLFAPIMTAIEQEKAFGAGDTEDERLRRLRIISDHLRGAVFLVADGVRFLNKEQGYVLRRVFRRALDQFRYPLASYPAVVDAVLDNYHQVYPQLESERQQIHDLLHQEAESYDRLVKAGLKRALATVRKRRAASSSPEISGDQQLTPDEAFDFYSTHGLSLDRMKQEGFSFDRQAVNQKIEIHRQKSRAGVIKKFGGHGLVRYALDTSDYSAESIARVTRLHTATHLLHQALRTVLGSHVQQRGSDITPDRLRFDFTHPTKLSPEQIASVERLINQQIQKSLAVESAELALKDALASGALSFFRERYPHRVTVYSVGTFSKEICGGPHVNNSSQIGKFKITSEKSSAAGIRRIKATVEP